MENNLVNIGSLHDFYKANLQYLINMNIREYDLEKSNIGILYEAKVIGEEQYQEYYTANKHERNVEIGVWMKQKPELINIYQDIMRRTRARFISENHIEDMQVLYIDNDSMTIIDNPNTDVSNRITQFGDHLNFRVKRFYTSFYKLGPIDFLYNGTNTGDYRIKYANINTDLHKNGFLDFLLTVFYEAEHAPLEEAIKKAEQEFEIYRKREMELLESDFDRAVKQLSINQNNGDVQSPSSNN